MTPTQTSATQVHAELLARAIYEAHPEFRGYPAPEARIRWDDLSPTQREIAMRRGRAAAALASPTAGAASDGVRALRRVKDDPYFSDLDAETQYAVDEALAAMPAPASSSDLGCQADHSPGDPANLAELMAAPASSSGVARPEIPWNNGNLQVRISGRWLVVDVANELARLIQGGARIEAIRALVTDEARHADRPHPLDSSGASK